MTPPSDPRKRFKQPDRLNIDRYTMGFLENKDGLTEDYWPLYAVASGVGAVLGWTWLLLLGSRANQIMKFSVSLSLLVDVFEFNSDHVSGLPFTMLVLQRAVKMVWNLPEVRRVACIFMLVMLLWLALWSFGAAGVVALGIGDGGRWWLLVVLCVSLFWTGAVLCNVVHVVVSGMVFLVLIHGGREATSMPPKPVMSSLQYAMTTSFGSICYGSLFTAAIRTLRWEIAVYGKSFNHSAKDAWELFQSTGVEALIAYDCSGAVLFMGTLLGGLIAGTCAAIWTRIKHPERIVMVGSTAMLMGMILVGLAMVVVESAVTSIYICYAEDPSLINRWDSAFFAQLSEKLHQRLQHRSSRAREVMTHRVDEQVETAV
ncbi:UNVERIFIED_CONTAM: CTL-like protein DDB [Sesamum radiatum]|uniref:Choline transporter-like protein n=1 Tax=Sesamum radiatum TaxID=300843 RepID=A0AAW2JTA8_SESRA